MRGVVVPVVLAAVLGLGAGAGPSATALVVGGGAVLGLVLWRVELAALAVVLGAFVETRLDTVVPASFEVLALLLLGSWAVRRVRGPLHRGPRTRVTDACVVLVSVVLLAALVHPQPGAGPEVLRRYLAMIAVTLVLVEVLRRPGRSRLAALAYVGAAGLAAGHRLLALVLRGPARVGGPPDLAFLLLAAVPLAIVLRRGARRTWPLDAVLVVLLLGIGATGSPGVLLGLAVMLLLAAPTRLLSPVAIAGVVGVLLLGVGLVAIVAPDAGPGGVDRAGPAAEHDVSRIGPLLEGWRAVARSTLEHPVLGLGPGALAEGSGGDRASTQPFGTAHSTWLEASAELGLLGLAALLAVLLAGLGAARRRWRRDREPLAAGVCAAYVATLVAATTATEQQLLPLWLLAALGAALDAESARHPEPGATRGAGGPVVRGVGRLPAP